MMQGSPERNIVIIGGGIIGSTSAYFITHSLRYDSSKHKVTIVEASSIASGASGKAGGLLALWAYPKCIVPLSFRLHKELAEQHGGNHRWGYRNLGCGSIECTSKYISSSIAEDENDKEGVLRENVSLQKQGADNSKRKLNKAGVPDDLDWLDAGKISSYSSMSAPGETAQVHPYQFTNSMAALATSSGAELILGLVTKILYSTDGKSVEGVQYMENSTNTEKRIPADTIIVCAGPWTRTILPGAPIGNLRAHSVTIRPARPLSGFAIFTEIAYMGEGKGRAAHVSPEIYARPNDEVYACGAGDTNIPLPRLASEVEVDEKKCQEIVDQVGSISKELREGNVLVRQAYYLPQVESGGGPLIGGTSVKGLILAAGHTCWGIQNAPATGKLVSEIVWDGKATSADIRTLDPKPSL